MRRRIRHSVAVASAICALAAASASAAPGDLDPSFGTYGKFVSDPPGATVDPTDVAVLGDGRVLVSGSTFDFAARASKGVLVRYTAAGAFDTSFGSGGVLELDPPAPSARALVLDPQGRILVAGVLDGPMREVAVARLLPDGSLDPAFGTGGVDATGISSAAQLAIPVDLALAPDGGIAIAGSLPASQGLGPGGIYVSRRLADGGPDLSFSGDGLATTAVGEGSAAGPVALAPDGSIVAAGRGTDASGRKVGAVVRFTAAGEPDSSFGTAGAVAIRFRGRATSIYDVAVDPDGDVVLAGTAGNDPVIARLTPSGQLDRGFATRGVFLARPGRGYADIAAIAVRPNGRVVGTGTWEGDARVLRLKADGGLDRAFARDGETTFGFGGNIDDAHELAIGPAGKIVIAGQQGFSGFRSSTYNLAVARLLAGGPKRDLDADGIVDRRDRCPTLPAEGHRGCPFIKRSISIRFDIDQFGVRVRSANRRCRGLGEVKLIQVVPGPDDVVATKPLVERKPIRFRRPNAEGTFFARITAAVTERAGLCGAAKSKRIVVGR